MVFALLLTLVNTLFEDSVDVFWHTGNTGYTHCTGSKLTNSLCFVFLIYILTQFRNQDFTISENPI